jgi:arsenate reductase
MPAVKVLFLCTGNSCRSQMAEGLLRNLAADKAEVWSAGTEPKPVHPLAVTAMQEIGIDISSQRSKSLEQLGGRDFDWLITVCDQARQSCPTFHGASRRTLHWNIPDPAAFHGNREESMKVFRSVRDELASRIRKFSGEIRGNQEV